MVAKAKDALNTHEDRIDAGVEGAGDFVDDKTGGRFEGRIDQGQAAVQDKTGNL
ncbi:antitoxin [Tessaracoccus sp. SD287]|nr:antitoxin [Tessaracoccus sp. SD287]